MSIAQMEIAAFGIVAAMISWFILNWIGKPILDVRSARLKALETSERYGFTGSGFSESEEILARAELTTAAASLRAFARAQPWAARVYCQILGYDLEMAARVLIGLEHLVGENLGRGSTLRRDQVIALHVLLKADGHLTAKETQDIAEKLANARLEKA